MTRGAEVVRAVARQWRCHAEAWARHTTVLMHKVAVLQDSVVSGPRFSVWTEARRWLASSTTLRLTVGPSVIRAALMRGDGPDWTAQCAWDSKSELTDSLARLAAELPQPCRRMTVALERPLVQLRTIPDLPPVRARVLPQLVAAQEGRFFRRNGHPLVADAVWVGDHGARVARAAAVEQPVVEAIVTGARAAGLRLVAITPAGEPRALSLLPFAERHARDRVGRRRLQRLALATGVVWAVAGALFVARLTWERRQVERALSALDEPLAAMRAARVELRAAESAVSAMRAVDGQRGRALATLGAIARALPDSVVATSFSWTSEGSGVLGGVGRRAADAVAALEHAGAVARPRFDGRIVRELVAGRDWERFTIVYGTRDAGRGRGRDE